MDVVYLNGLTVLGFCDLDWCGVRVYCSGGVDTLVLKRGHQ